MAKVDPGRILDVSKWQPPTIVHKTKNAKGVPIEVIEKVPGTFHEQWLNPAGFVVRLSLGNANARAEGGKTPYYEQQKAFKSHAHNSMKLIGGWIPWGRCPVAMVMSQEITSRSIANHDILLESPCTPDIDRPFGPKNPCKHALAEKACRAAIHEEAENSKREQYKKDGELDRELSERQHSETIAALTAGQNTTASALEALLKQLIADKQSAANQSEKVDRPYEPDERDVAELITDAEFVGEKGGDE